MRSAWSSPWVSSIAVLNLFMLTAGAVVFAMPGSLSASELMLGALVGTACQGPVTRSAAQDAAAWGGQLVNTRG